MIRLEQVLAAAVDVLDPLARDDRRSPSTSALGAIRSLKPMIALSGVRSSWLMLARKSLLAALAASSAATVSASRTLEGLLLGQDLAALDEVGRPDAERADQGGIVAVEQARARPQQDDGADQRLLGSQRDDLDRPDRRCG